MGSDPRDLERTTIPDGPDTVPSDFLSDTLSSESEEISVKMESSAVSHARRAASDPARTLDKTARSLEQRRSPAATQGQNSSHTTQQSMLRPEVKMSGAPHSRRFLSIENDLSHMEATLRLLEKSLASTQKEARIAWILAALALLAAGVAMSI